MHNVAAVTIIQDDAFFLSLWLRHYESQIGRGNCYVISYGASQDQIDMALGCNITRLPVETTATGDRKPWKILRNFASALGFYHTHVIVGAVDELVLADPDSGGGLAHVLGNMAGGQVLTPLGLELIHRVDCEAEPIGDTLLGPRRHVRPAPGYSKPCVLSSPTSLSRGGRFGDNKVLKTPSELLLLRLRYCDRSHSDQPDSLFDGFANLDMQAGFDLDPLRRRMHQTWERRGNTEFWQFAQPDHGTQYRLPDRFLGLF